MQWIVHILGWILLGAAALMFVLMGGLADNASRAASKGVSQKADREALLFFVITFILTAGLGAVMVWLSWPS